MRAHSWLGVLVVVVILLSVGVPVEKGRKGHHQTNMCFQSDKSTHTTSTYRYSSDLSRKYRKAEEVRVVFSYRCQTRRTICTQTERSIAVATNNGLCMPTYVDRICENMCSPTNQQGINRHEKNSVNNDHAIRSRETMTTATQLQQQT